MPLFHITGSSWITALGWTMVDCLWQSLLIWAICQVLLTATRRSDARIRYGISLAAMLGIFVWFGLDLIRQLSLQAHALIQGNAAPAMTVNGGLYPYMATPVIPSYWYDLQHGLQACFPVFSLLYVTGMIFCAMRLSIAAIKAGRLKRFEVNECAPYLAGHMERLKTVLQITRRVELKISLRIDVPLVTGWMKPVILLPITALTQLSAEQLEAVLIHELSHIKRLDYLVNLLQCIGETVLCFNPLVWLISSRIRQERENCCDDMVVSTVSPLSYAHALVTLEEQRIETNSLVMAAVSDRPQLFHRIKRMMEMKKTTLNGSQVLLVAFLLAVAVASVAWLNPSHSSRTTNRTVRAHAILHGAAVLRDTIPAENADSSDEVTVTGSDSSAAGKVLNTTNGDSSDGTVHVRGENGSRMRLEINYRDKDHDTLSGQYLVDDKNAPLYIVDGKPVRSLSHISPGSIRSISVLKNTDSSFEYGDRAKNGVVIVTTKHNNPDDNWLQLNLQTKYKFNEDSIFSKADQISMEVRMKDMMKNFKYDTGLYKMNMDKMMRNMKKQMKVDSILRHQDWSMIKKQLALTQKQVEFQYKTMDSSNKVFHIVFDDSAGNNIKWVQLDSLRVLQLSRMNIDSLKKFQWVNNGQSLKIKLMNRNARDMAYNITDNMGDRNGEVHEMISDMTDDHLIADPDRYSVDLGKSSLVIDGKKQPQDVFEKYHRMMGDATVQIKHDHGNHESFQINESDTGKKGQRSTHNRSAEDDSK